MQVFLDADVGMDFLARRKGFFADAARIIELGHAGKASLCASALSYSHWYYHLRKGIPQAEVIRILTVFKPIVRPLTVDDTMISQALVSGWPDFEDAVQHFAAFAHGADVIVTRNAPDFKRSKVKVMSPSTLVKALSF